MLTKGCFEESFSNLGVVRLPPLKDTEPLAQSQRSGLYMHVFPILELPKAREQGWELG